MGDVGRVKEIVLIKNNRNLYSLNLLLVFIHLPSYLLVLSYLLSYAEHEHEHEYE